MRPDVIFTSGFFYFASFVKGDFPARENVAKRQKGCRLGERGAAKQTEGLFIYSTSSLQDLEPRRF